ncbi:helicase-primase subunit [Pteropodid alphaherpesvirus 1]|uniref:Helicase-primase subunit n=1 Tax=Pteropodid alphaherpesvirus 1 TaxID=1343901 RepID=A0A060Q1T7_9ALPH|nr:helicase-primase subunit [Pteropodid alphaherpesvirus 1]BAP00687.1 helicase-primase subunit [Pteropodid alphaherpesvirus 1]
MVRAASTPASHPLETLRDPQLWRSLYACLRAALEHKVGPVAFFAPYRVGLCAQTGLVERLHLNETPAPTPQAALLSVEAKVELDPLTIAARVSEYPNACLAWARLSALQAAPKAASSAALRVTITTTAARFKREYASLSASPREKEGAIEDVFTVHSLELRPRGHAKSVTVRVPLPVHFDYLVGEASSFSMLALIALFRHWHRAVYADAQTVAPVFAFLGAEFEVGGQRDETVSTLGFPGWPLFRVSATPSAPRPAKDAMCAYTTLSGLWPTAGLAAFLAPQEWTRRALSIGGQLTPLLRDAVSRWHSAPHTPQLLDPPALIGPVWLTQFRFQPTAKSALLALFDSTPPPHSFPQANAKLSAVTTAARTQPWADALLTAISHRAQDTYPAVAQLLGGIMNALWGQIETTANSVPFAVCGGSEAAFWGVFNVDPEDAASARAMLASAQAAFETSIASLFQQNNLRLGAPPLTPLGLFTHAVIWSHEGRWFWNAHTQAQHLEGFPRLSSAHAQAGEVVSQTLCQLVTREDVPPPEAPAWAYAVCETACDNFVQSAFLRRLDVNFWSVITPPELVAEPLPPSALRGDAHLDRDRGARRVVRVCSQEGAPKFVPIDLYAAPLVLPPIDCSWHLRPILKEMETVFHSALTSLWGDAHPFVYSLDERLAFLFPH